MGQNDTVDHPFLTFRKIKWYFSEIAVSFNLLVIGIDSFDKNILQSQNRLFKNFHFAPTTLYHFAPVTSSLLISLQFKSTTPHSSSEYLETY